MIESADGKNRDHHQRKRKRKPTEVPEIGAIQQSLVQLEDIKYPRAERTKKHLLTDILLYYTYQLSWLGK